MIEVQNLTKVYVDKRAVDNISFFIKEGEIVGFLGPNGAGKTTTIRMLTGFLPPTEGKILIGGYEIGEKSLQARKLIGYMPESAALYNELRVIEYLKFRGELNKVPSKELKNNIDYILDACFIKDVKDKIIGNLSKGYRQRVALAGVLVHNPKVLILDEPTIGLDPVQIVKIRELIKEIGRERTVFISTHILPEAEMISDRVLVIDKGKILAQDTPQNLKNTLKGNTIYEIQIKPPLKEIEEFRKIEGVIEIEKIKDTGEELHLKITGEKNLDLREKIYDFLYEKKIKILGLTEKTLSMEDVFLRLTMEEKEVVQ
ncbi:MAG: ATP-binding cassette domain-containing protein [Thermoanaerobaculia bacterium]